MTNPPPPPPWGGPNQPTGPTPGLSPPGQPGVPGQPPPGQPGVPAYGGGPSGGVPPSPPPGWTQTAAPAPLSSAARMWAWIGVATAALVGIAAFLVWARFPGGALDGSDLEIKGIGGDDAGVDDSVKDGAITLTLAIGAAILGIIRGLGRWALAAAIVILVCGALTTLVALADIGDISDTEEDFGVTIDVGVGLWLTLVGGLAMTAVGIVAIVKRR